MLVAARVGVKRGSEQRARAQGERLSSAGPGWGFVDHAAVGKLEPTVGEPDCPAILAKEAARRSVIDAADIDEQHELAAEVVWEPWEWLLESEGYLAAVSNL